MATLVQTLKSLFGQPQSLGQEVFPLDPRLADMMAKAFPVPVMVIDREADRMHWVSPGFLEMSRANPDHLRAESARAVLERYFSPARALTDLYDHKALMAEVKAALQSEDGTTYDVLGVWMGMRLDPIQAPRLYLLVFQDVTEEERLKAELHVYSEELKQQVDELSALQAEREKLLSELKEQAEHLRMLASIVANTSVMALILDKEGRILWVNWAFEKRYGYTRGEAVGKHICELPGVPCHLLPKPNEDPSNIHCIAQRLSPQGLDEEAYYHSPGGDGFWAHVTITPVLDEVGEVKYYTVLMQDITARKAREEELRERNAELEGSIRYAARLQRAFMPKNLDGLRAYFKDVGLWYQPLEALGGDFYGYLPVENGVVLGIGDATGHGVPAALISIYALTSLYEKVKQHGLYIEKVYEELMESIRQFFRERNQASEGFELGLLAYEPGTQTAHYLGARRPLWLLRHGEIYIVEGGRTDVAGQTLPGSASVLQPTLQTLRLEPGDRLYLFSDGLVDQIGGPDRKRFSRTRLSSFLRANSYLPMSEIIQLLQEAIRTFMGTEPQTDDIVFLGLEV
jgi:PAS domain S-box-containing protein